MNAPLKCGSTISGNALIHISDDEYFADPCVSPSLTQSIAHTLVTKSPAHAYLEHPRLGGGTHEASSRFDLGSMVHTIVLSAGREVVPLDFPDWRKKDARTERDRLRAAGKVPILAHQYDGALFAAERITETLSSMGIALVGKSELGAFWEERADNGNAIQCRAKLDHWDEFSATVFDLKTSANAHPDAVARSMFEYGYDIQGAAYTSAIERNRPDLAGRVRFLDLFCEFEPPYAVTPVLLDGSMRELGCARWRRGINLWEKCLSSKTWPAYVRGPVSVEAPQYALIREASA